MRLTPAFVLAALMFVPRQQTPVFRARVDLVTVDVAVVDRDGKPVTQLAPDDFTITAAGRRRRVVSAEYVTIAPTRTRTPVNVEPVTAPASTSNSQPSDGRTFLFVVDVDHIPSGGGRIAMQTVADYIERFAPADRVGVVSVPYGTPRVDVTTNHRMVRDALVKLFGAHQSTPQIYPTVGEAAGIERLDSGALQDYLDRIGYGCNDQPPSMSGAPMEPKTDGGVVTIVSRTPDCILRWQPMASRFMDQERQRSRALLDTLRALALAMAPIDGPKGLVLISQGLVNDRETTADLREFAAAAEKARVTLYGINLDSTIPDATARYAMSTAFARDQQVLLDGMSTLAIAGRGDVFMTSGTPINALARIDAETSGYYLLSFERDGGDRDGQRAAIDVAVNWPGAVVRARKEFTPNATADAAATPARVQDLKAAIGEVLRWPIPITDLGVDVATYSTLGPSDGELRTVVAATAATAGKDLAAVGYEITDVAGQVVADGYDPKSGVVTSHSVRGDRRLYLAGVALRDGAYRLKVAVLDASGRRGSVEHAFEVHDVRAGRIRVSEIFSGEIANDQFLPNPWVMPGSTALPLRLDLAAANATAFTGATMSLELARVGAPAFATMRISLRDGSDAQHRTAMATLAIGALPPDQYVVTARLRAADGASATRSRIFLKR